MKLPNHCKLCFQPPVVIPDITQPKVVYKNKKETTTISHPLKPHPSGLCFYHLKKAEGWFDLLYPFSKYGQPHTQVKGALRAQLIHAFGPSIYGGLFKDSGVPLERPLK